MLLLARLLLGGSGEDGHGNAVISPVVQNHRRDYWLPFSGLPANNSVLPFVNMPLEGLLPPELGLIEKGHWKRFDCQCIALKIWEGAAREKDSRMGWIDDTLQIAPMLREERFG